jgi:bacterioferritin-associated ferredoxin
LWRRRQFDHITFSEIEAFARINSVYDVERFAALIMHCDQCVHDTAAAIKEERDKLEKLANLKGKE